jgi:hypothetical protein
MQTSDGEPIDVEAANVIQDSELEWTVIESLDEPPLFVMQPRDFPQG